MLFDQIGLLFSHFIMTDTPNPSGGKPQQVNLQQIAQQFMAGLQQHFDMLAFNLAARDDAKEESYNKRVQAPRIMPAANRHQNFEQMQAYARDLMVRQVINDSLNLAVTGMNNAHFFLALVKATGAQPDVNPESQKLAQESQQRFLRAQLDEKFNILESEYSIMCELEDSIISLGFVIQALMQQGGQVGAPQLDEKGELILELKAVKVIDPATEGDKPVAKLVDQRKVFKENERITFSDVDLQLILVTVASFADALFKSVAGYAKSVREGGAA